VGGRFYTDPCKVGNVLQLLSIMEEMKWLL